MGDFLVNQEPYNNIDFEYKFSAGMYNITSCDSSLLGTIISKLLKNNEWSVDLNISFFVNDVFEKKKPKPLIINETFNKKPLTN